jgi:uncharacterized protein
MKKFNMILIGFMLLLAAALPASAAENNVSKLIVQGEGTVRAAPDVATVVLGVETQNASASGAAAENAKLMNETIAALRSAGIAEKDIQTSGYSLTTAPEEQPKTAGEKPKAPLFIATNQVTVGLNDTGKVGLVLDAAVAAGSNSIQSVGFDIRNPQPEKDKALTLAIEDARRKAEVAAKAASVKLGRVMEISEGYGYVSAAPKRAAYAADIATPIQPGEMEVTASVTVTYEVS